ncbi:MAG: hypothetical protein ACRDIY_22640 [Chloroflexota bacterium]
MPHSTQPNALDALVRELDVLIRARYPLIAVNTFEEVRFRRLIAAVANLERHRAKGLFVWSRTHGLHQIAGPGLGPHDRAIPDTEDPLSVLEHIDQAERGLFVLCDYAPYLAPFGQEEPQLVRRLRELAWTIKIRPTSEVKREEIEELRKWAREHLAIDAVKGHPTTGDRYLEV